MQYVLTLADKDSTKDLIYDTAVSTLTWADTGEILTTSLGNKPNGVVKRKIISLGFSCNYSCSYCLQPHLKLKKISEEDMDTLLEELYKEDLTNTRVEFWGGEPLLYYDAIQYMGERLTDRVKNFMIISNCSLLTKERLDTLIDLNFDIVMSYDCQTHKEVRGSDPIEKNPELFNYMFTKYKDRTSLNSVMENRNYITQDRLDWIKNLIGVDDINLGGEGFVIDYGYNTVSKTDNINVYKDIIVGEGMKNSYYQGLINGFINTIKDGKKLTDIIPSCGITKDNYYSIHSLEKRNLTCHNFDKPFTPVVFKDRPHCHKCLVAHICKGQCPALQHGTESFKKNCELNQEVFTQIIRVVVFILTNEKYQVIDIKEI